MSNVTPFSRPVRWEFLRSDEAEKLIRERAKDTANIRITDHAFDRIKERDITQADLYDILRTGTVTDAPEKAKGEDWKVCVRKRLRGHREAVVVTVIVRKGSSLVILTVMWRDRP